MIIVPSHLDGECFSVKSEGLSTINGDQSEGTDGTRVFGQDRTTTTRHRTKSSAADDARVLVPCVSFAA
jgi:hypothetical protein